MQGIAYVHLDTNTIRMVSGGASVTITPGGVAITGGFLTHNGVNVGDSHTHGGVVFGADRTTNPG